MRTPRRAGTPPNVIPRPTRDLGLGGSTPPRTSSTSCKSASGGSKGRADAHPSPPPHHPLAPRPLPLISSHPIVSPRQSRRASLKMLKELKVRLSRAPRPESPRETRQSTIVPAPPKQSAPKPNSLIDPYPPPSSFLRRQASIPSSRPQPQPSHPLIPPCSLDVQCYPFPRRFRAHIYPTSPTRAPIPRAPGLHNCSTFRSTNSSLHRPRRPSVLEGADHL